jgi:hypothetical protein
MYEALENNTVLQHLSSVRQSMAYWTLYKLRLSLPLNYFVVLKSYLHSRYFLVKVEAECTEVSPVNVGVPQGIVIGPLLYLLCTVVRTNFSDKLRSLGRYSLLADSDHGVFLYTADLPTSSDLPQQPCRRYCSINHRQ